MLISSIGNNNSLLHCFFLLVVRYRELGEESEFQRLTDMMSELEKRDALVQKLDATTKLMVQAWHCRQCNTYSEHRPRECAAHALVKVGG
jgi:hypothetical protein